MKSILKIYNIKSTKDINRIKRTISNNEGIVACQVNRDKDEVIFNI